MSKVCVRAQTKYLVFVACVRRWIIIYYQKTVLSIIIIIVYTIWVCHVKLVVRILTHSALRLGSCSVCVKPLHDYYFGTLKLKHCYIIIFIHVFVYYFWHSLSITYIQTASLSFEFMNTCQPGFPQFVKKYIKFAQDLSSLRKKIIRCYNFL